VRSFFIVYPYSLGAAGGESAKSLLRSMDRIRPSTLEPLELRIFVPDRVFCDLTQRHNDAQKHLQIEPPAWLEVFDLVAHVD
jgi:hypothetical protein